MGTIVFYQTHRAGTPAQPDTQVVKLDNSLIRTTDTTTSTTAESITVGKDTTLLGVIATTGAHRIAATSAATSDSGNYYDIPEESVLDPQKIVWLGVTPGETYYYRLNA